jgi:hypothetical protein
MSFDHGHKGSVDTLLPQITFPGQRKMCSIIVVVTDVLVHQPPQMAFIQHDHLVEQISAAASDPALSTPFCQGLRKLVRFG